MISPTVGKAALSIDSPGLLLLTEIAAVAFDSTHTSDRYGNRQRAGWQPRLMCGPNVDLSA